MPAQISILKHTMTYPLLSTTTLFYHAQDRVLLNKVSFNLHAGQKVVLVGRSGSGKSLLLQALNDLLPLSDDNLSRIMLNNLPISQIPPAEYRAKVALFHQTPSLIEGTVLENLAMPFEFKYHQNKLFDKNWHAQKLKKFGKSEDFIHQDISHLSGGERQLVAFLRTLQLNPTIALFDEPTSALDNETALCLMDLVLDWHDEHKAFIWVTHTPDEQHKLGADLWRMEHGVLEVNDGNLA